jgi:hypothetical protein
MVFISVIGSLNSGAMVRLEGLGELTKKNQWLQRDLKWRPCGSRTMERIQINCFMQYARQEDL